MTTVSLGVPDEAIQVIGPTPEEFACALRLAAAMFWYGRSEVSQGTAAAIAGMNLRDFLFALSRNEQDIFVVDMDDLRRELSLG